ncbi:MAG: hypothetical protein WA005_16245 [Candidatus Binataceae bacterium]
MKAVQLCLPMLIAAVLMTAMGGMRASAQILPTATPTPGACSITQIGSAKVDCRTGAEDPPSFLGVSGGNINSVDATGTSCCTGTFGALVKDTKSVDYVLGTNYALARASNGVRSASRNELIVQPGLVDLGCWQDTTDTVAKLWSWVPIGFAGPVPNTMDAAIAKVVTAQASPGAAPTPGIDPLGRIFNIGQISTTPFPFDSLEDGLRVMKMGRGSCLTTGQIDAFDAMGKVVYPAKTCNALGAGAALFNHQILVMGVAQGDLSGQTCTFAENGDSGALVLLQNFTCPQAIGVLFAAAGPPFTPTGGVIAAVTPIQTILTRFKVSLVGKACTTSDFLPEINSPAPEMTDALRASINTVRAVKERYADALLKHEHVTAVGIGAGDDPNTASLAVYVDDDSPETTANIPKQFDGVQVKIKQAGKFSAL